MMFDRKFSSIGLAAVVISSALFFTAIPLAVTAQDPGIFETASVEAHLRNKFKLTAQDMRRLRPMIRRENEDVVIIFSRQTDEESTSFMSLWDRITSQRSDFERDHLTGLTLRQKQALRDGRFEFEARILDMWLDEYIQRLAELLELDSVQVSLVERVFDTEQDRRLKLWSKNPSASINLDPAWVKLSVRRERSLANILNPIQLRDYRTLSSSGEPLIGKLPIMRPSRVC